MRDPHDHHTARPLDPNDERFLEALERGVADVGDPLVALCAALPAYDLPKSNVERLRARLHTEFDLAHAGATHAARQRTLGRVGRVIELGVVASVCVIQIVWLFTMLQHH